MNAKILLAGLMLVAFASLALAGNTQYERGDQILVRAFGTPGTAATIEPAASASARNASALSKNEIHLLVCNSDVRYKLGGSTVTAAATDSLLPATQMLYFNTKANDYVAVYGDGAAAKCTVTPFSAPTD